jgi:VIT1/CCC1 family predicted Fe2+/Mn2+ transporter
MSAVDGATSSAPRAEIHHEHRDVTGGWLRPAVFGAMDGLVSNFALIAGVAGGRVHHQVIVLTGLAGLAAGAFSMAAGEYISVASQSELALAEIEVERREIERSPEAEELELAQLYEARGLEPGLVSRVTARSWWFGGARQLILGGAAAIITFAVGSLIGGNSL